MNDSERKPRKVSEEDFIKIKAYEALSDEKYKEQVRLEREDTLAVNEIRRAHMLREIAFKEIQISSDKLLEKHEEYIDNVKPMHILKNEIDGLNHQMRLIERVNKQTREEMAKDDSKQ